MAAATQSPRVVIATRNALIEKIGDVGGDRITEKQKESLADWMISSGYLADAFYEEVAARLSEGSDPVEMGR